MTGMKKLKTAYSSLSVCLAAAGGILLFRPGVPAGLFGRAAGILLLLFGAVKLLGYFSDDRLQLAFQFDFAMGILSALLGIALLLRPEALMGKFSPVAGLFFLAAALLRVQTAMDARKIGVAQWPVILVIALITAVNGCVLFFLPFDAAAAVRRLFGFNMAVDGILNLFVVQSTVTTNGRHKHE